jgi:hypothetical protein
MANLTNSIDLIGAFAEHLARAIAARMNLSAGGQEKSRSSTAGRRSGKRSRRSSESLEALSGELVTYVKANPGKGIGEIARSVGQPPSSIVPSVRKLVAAKKLKTKGQKRGMKYFAK